MESREEIRQRILRAAARAWKLDESQMDLEAFDPLVRLLVEANSGEFARLERTLMNSEERILDRMLEQLSPEVLTGPKPAHAIATARSLRPTDLIRASDQFYAGVDNGREQEDVYFSPVDDYTICDAAIAFQEAAGKVLYAQAEDGSREYALRGDQTVAVPTKHLYLALRLGEQVTDLAGMRFYFHWLNAPNQEELLTYLRMAEWSIAGSRVRVRAGIQAFREGGGPDVGSLLAEEYSRYARSRREIIEGYNAHFITLLGTEGVPEAIPFNKVHYPQELASYYPVDELKALPTDLVWLKITFPTQFPTGLLSNTICAANAFPVVNYRWISTRTTLRDQVNIVALPTEEHYFDVVRVENQRGEAYHQVPLTNIRHYDAGQFSVRYRDVGKLDHRAAGRNLMNLLDALRDESAAFSAYGLDTLNTKLIELRQNLKNLEQIVLNDGAAAGHHTYLMAKPKSGDRTLTINYLSSAGERGNRLLAGTKLDLRRSGRIRRKSLHSVTSSRGGREPLGSQDRKYAYKKAIVSRGRVVSREDIRAFAAGYFGALLAGVIIKKGYSTGIGPGQGLQRTVDVELHLTAEAYETTDLDRLRIRSGNLERELNQHTSSVLPIRVLLGELKTD